MPPTTGSIKQSNTVYCPCANANAPCHGACTQHVRPGFILVCMHAARALLCSTITLRTREVWAGACTCVLCVRVRVRVRVHGYVCGRVCVSVPVRVRVRASVLEWAHVRGCVCVLLHRAKGLGVCHSGGERMGDSARTW
jgi:hypothetical protein